ncbi:MAG: hypothetical protein RIQ95_2348, partial [Pseudomonadota bacterium]
SLCAKCRSAAAKHSCEALSSRQVRKDEFRLISEKRRDAKSPANFGTNFRFACVGAEFDLRAFVARYSEVL